MPAPKRLARDNGWIVVRMDQNKIALFDQRFHMRLGFRNCLTLQHHLSTVSAGRVHLHERCCHRHDNGGRDAKTAGMVGHSLGMIAG